MRRVIQLLLIASALLVWAAAPASAHAQLESSDPPNGATVGAAIQAVTLSFTEQPDPALSVVRVVSDRGAPLAMGRPASSGPRTIRSDLPPLKTGTYTVSWRVVSVEDGHLTSGGFAFGVGVAAVPVTGQTSQSTSSPLGPPSRLMLYFGLFALTGAVWCALVVYRRSLPRLRLLLAVGWALSAVGLAGLAAGLASDGSVSVAALLGTSTGIGVWLRIAGLAVALIGLGWVYARREARFGFWLAGLGAAIVMFAHARAGHAGAGPMLGIIFQTVHIGAAAAWIGGLAALIAVLPSVDPVERRSAAKRFSVSAGVALFVVVATGTLRTIAEVSRFSSLYTTTYGRLVSLKIALLAVLALLGLRSRRRHVAEAGSGLRRTALVEVLVAAVLLGATAMLSSRPPTIAPPPTQAISARGADFGTVMRGRLEASPGAVGLNTFTLHLTDYDSMSPAAADRVTLRLASKSRADVAPSTLTMRRGGPGRWTASGPHLSLPGLWDVTALVVQGGESISIGMTLRVPAPKPQIRVDSAPGQPTLYTADLTDGHSVQVYLDPQHAGQAQLHVTYFDPTGRELAVDAIAIAAKSPNGRRLRPESRKFGPGHVVADIELVPGRWTFTPVATFGGGSLTATIPVRISEGS